LKKFIQNIPTELTSPFRSVKGLNKPLIVVFLSLNSLVMLNACLHDPFVGYDVGEHLKYIETLAKMRLPTVTDTAEFYSPPLPYRQPALAVAAGAKDLWWPAKLGQLLNALLSIALTFYLLKICDFFAAANDHLKTTTLLSLGLLPVYYKSFAFVRGEPFVAFFVVFIVYQALLLFVRRRWNWPRVVVLGAALGLLVLSRQWGFLLFPGLILWVIFLTVKETQKNGERLRLIKMLLVVLTISFLVGSWFYLNLPRHNGAATNFNRSPAPSFSLSNQPSEFYFGLGSDKLFSDPLRPAFPNRFLPIFYSELWGDYWQYFVVAGYDLRTGAFISGGKLEELTAQQPIPEWLATNRFRINAYLGRINLVSLFPTALGLVAIFFGLKCIRYVGRNEGTDQAKSLLLVMLYVIISLAGYFWFLVMYPNLGKGDTIKATYLLQTFPFIALLVGIMLQIIREKKRLVYRIIMLFLVIVWLHNLPAMLTHYISQPGLRKLLL
jgi:hypothetical protein